MNVLVTGGAGFIGSHLCEKLVKQNVNVFCLDNFNNYYDPNVKRKNISSLTGKKNFTLIEGDIRDEKLLEKIFSENSFEKIIHLAARAGVRPSIEQPLLYIDVNISGTANLLEKSVKHKIKQFVFASSSSVYGLNQKTPFSEKDSTDNQISPYAVSKKAGEQLCYYYSKNFSLPITCLRFFTVYGPRGRPDMAVYKFARKINSGEKISVYGDNSVKRDFTYIDDIVNGIIKASEKNFSFEIINLGNNNPVTVSKIIELIEKEFEKKALKEQKPLPKADVPITFADVSKAKKLLGWQPKISVEQGIKKFADWFKNQ